MLSCPCKMIKPFTFATTKKSSAFRYNSVLRMPSGCSFYYTKNILLLHVVRNKPFSRKEWTTQRLFFKEQKNFIWTSLLIWKNKDDKNTQDAGNPPKPAQGEVNVNVENKLKKVPEDLILDTSTKISSEQKSSTEKNNNITEGILKSIKSNDDPKNKNATEFGHSIGNSKPVSDKKKDVDSDKKIEKYIEENIALSDNKNKISNIKTSLGEISGIDSKVLVKPVKKDLPKTLNPIENSKVEGKFTIDGDPKRQIYERSLGEIKNVELNEPPNIFNTETGRATDEITLSKDGPQNFFEKAKNIFRKTSAVGKPDENERVIKAVELGEPKGNINLGSPTRRRQTVDLNRSSTERNFITPVRAMTDFLLKPSDLEGLRKTKRRSPYENDPPITVYWRKDVEAKAIDVWGSKENLLKEILKRDIERRRYQQNLFTVKRRLRDYRREQGRESEIKADQSGLFGSSGRVVLTAIAINGANFLFKLVAWLYTGSHSMFSEAIHSLADTINQLILAYGIHKSVQRADSDHPYGYTNMRYVASLISGVGIFCVGSGLSFYHGVIGLTEPADLPSFYWAYFILGGSLASEGATLLVAFNSIRLGALKSETSLSEYILRGQDPSVNVVLLEDAAAVVGVAVAGCCMGLSSYYGSHIPDALGSFLVGGLLACVASFIIYTNVAALVGRSIPQERLDKINTELESDVMIRAIHDVKGIDIGNSLVRYKAELDFDGGELTRSYLDKQDLNQMLEEVKKMKTIDELEEFMLKHGENIVDMMGGEIDRIELKLRKKHPEIRHCDLEIL